MTGDKYYPLHPHPHPRPHPHPYPYHNQHHHNVYIYIYKLHNIKNPGNRDYKS